MRISELLHSIASWLSSPDNEAILLAEYDEECLKKTAEGCLIAANVLKKTAEEVDKIEPEQEETAMTPENIEGLADIATAFDESGDEYLQKQASLIDELLISIAAPKYAAKKMKDKNESKIDELKQKYQDIKKSLIDKNMIQEATTSITKSNIYNKQKRPLEAALSTRYCPDHAGSPLKRISSEESQCSLDNKIYNFKEGYRMLDKTEVPGGSVELQNEGLEENTESAFDTREDRASR